MNSNRFAVLDLPEVNQTVISPPLPRIDALGSDASLSPRGPKSMSSSKKKPKKRNRNRRLSETKWLSETKGRTSSRTLCDVCKSIFDQKRTFNIYHQHHKKHSELEEAANSFCYICGLLWEKVVSSRIKILPSNNSDLSQKSGLQYQFAADGIPDFALVFIYTDSHKTLTRLLKLTLHMYIDELETMLTKKSIGSSSGSAESLKMARHWLQNCLKTHTSDMPLVKDNQTLPARLIFVGPRQGGQARLCDGAEQPLSSRYLTLSHCWGKYPIFSTKTHNIESLKKEIKFENLPKVFQDAIFITRELGFEYLWIDSLCIVQDCSEDWHREGSRMGRIYQSAVCNIAATGFDNGQTGLFVDRDIELLLPLKLVNVWCAEIGCGDRLMEENWWDNGVDNAPLNQRAWVLQERLLSPRILHFGSRQIFWECHGRGCNEIFPTGVGTEMNNDCRDSMKEVWESLNRRGNFFDICEFWENLIMTYSKGQLTYLEDKLAALSGVASEMQGITGDQYLAGMWKDNLLRQLLWVVSQDTHPNPNPNYRAPTWSWASTDAEISYGMVPISSSIDLIPHSTILHAQTVPISNNLTGPVSNGFIQIRGPLREVHRMNDAIAGWDGECTDSSETVEINIYPDIMLLEEQCDRTGSSLLHLKLSTVNNLTVQNWQNLDIFSRYTSIFLLPILSANKDESSQMFGLILTSCRSLKGQFQRIGVFRVFGKANEQSIIYKALMASLETIEVLIEKIYARS